jgi:putative phosphoesterase
VAVVEASIDAAVGIKKQDTLRIGVLSDTHGLLRDEVLSALEGVDQIIHAGDVGCPDILDALEMIAPVVAVRGNMDRDDRPGNLPKTEMVRIGSGFIYVLHNLYDLDLVPEAADILAVISGHTHRPSVAEKNGVLYLNPGGAGHRRFDYPVSVAVLVVENRALTPRLIEFDV